MTVHMFRLCVSQSGLSQAELETRVQSWVDEHTKWEGGNTSFSVALTQGEIGNPESEYYSGRFRFEKTDTKDNIVQKLTDKLNNKVSWYRVGYHDCSHDEIDSITCNWGSTVEWSDKDVSIPGYVPDMN